jgi:hypothetical protein
MLSERAILAVITAHIRNQGFKKYAFTPIGKSNGIYPFAVAASFSALLIISTARARQIVLGIGTEYPKLLMRIRPGN